MTCPFVARSLKVDLGVGFIAITPSYLLQKVTKYLGVTGGGPMLFRLLPVVWGCQHLHCQSIFWSHELQAL